MIPRWKRYGPVRLNRVRCDRHPDLPGTLKCVCGARVRTDALIHRGKKMLGLGVVGTPGAGKTTMMLAAMHEMAKARVPEKLLGIGDTDGRFSKLRDRLFNERLQPERTKVGKDDGFGWRVRRQGMGPAADRLLVMQDLDGSTWNGDAKEKPEIVARYFTMLDKIVVVLDGARIATDLGLHVNDGWEPERTGTGGLDDNTVFSNLLDVLGDRASQVSVALAVSKGDLLWSQSGKGDLQKAAERKDSAVVDHTVRDLLVESGRGAVVEFAGQFRQNHQFIFSSLGFRPVVNTQGVLTAQPSPVGAEQPIRWLLGTG